MPQQADDCHSQVLTLRADQINQSTWNGPRCLVCGQGYLGTHDCAVLVCANTQCRVSSFRKHLKGASPDKCPACYGKGAKP